MRLRFSGSCHSQISFLALLVLVIGICGCAAMPDAQSITPNSPSGGAAQPSAQIHFCNTPGIGCSSAVSFSISKLRDLNIVVSWSNLPSGNHTQLVSVLHSSGGLYQSFHSGFMVNPEDGGAFSSSTLLPVAGTWIVQRSMTGSWTVQALLDGHIISTQTVTLNP